MMRKVLLVWLLMALFMIMNGTVRELVYAPFLGEYGGHVISTVLGVGIVLLFTHVFIRRNPDLQRGMALRIGLAWLGLTIAFEFLFGHYVDGASWGRLLADYDIANGRLWLLVLASLVFAPLFWVSRRSA